MEGPRARKLTTVLVAVGVALAVVCLLVGAVLAVGSDDELSALGLRAVGEGVLAGRPSAWLSLGALFLISTPCLRLVGLLVVFHAEGERKALAACVGLLTLILLGLANALV